MQGDGLPESQSPQVLLAETRRVLDAQQRLVQRQRAQATNVLRIILTSCGLILTLASLAVSAELSGLGDTTGHWVVSLVGAGSAIALPVGAIVTLLACRMLCAALVVLEPQTTKQAFVRILTTPIRARTRPNTPTPGDVSFRAGLDADATTDLSDATDPIRDVVAYNAGCVAGNALLIQQNRWYLTRVYRSGVVCVAFVTMGLLGVIAIHVVSLPG